MKTLVLILALGLCLGASSFHAQSLAPGQRGVSIELKSATTSDYVRQGCRSLTFIFSTNFVGTIQGIAFAGATDTSITIPVQTGDVLGDVYYTVTTGSMRLVYTK